MFESELSKYIVSILCCQLTTMIQNNVGYSFCVSKLYIVKKVDKTV